MDDPKIKEQQNQPPSYYNPSGITRESLPNATPLLNVEPIPQDPQKIMQSKYPIKTIAALAFLIVAVLAIPVGVYLNQRPTQVHIEATATPSPTPSPTPSESPRN